MNFSPLVLTILSFVNFSLCAMEGQDHNNVGDRVGVTRKRKAAELAMEGQAYNQQASARLVGLMDRIKPDAKGKVTPEVEIFAENVIPLIKEQMADPDVEDKFCRTPLTILACCGYTEQVRYLLSVRNNNKRVVQVNRVVPMCRLYSSPYTPLRNAWNNPEITKLLIEAGAEVTPQKQYKEDALWNNPNDEVVKILLKAGADPDYVTSHEETHLTRATSKNLPTIVKSLLEAGAIVDKPNEHGQTALEIARLHGFTDIERMLLEYKAAQLRKCIDAKQVLSEAKKEGYNVALRKRIRNSDDEAVKILLDAGADPDYCDENDHDTHLTRATLYNRATIVALLLEAGAIVDKPNADNQTALEFAQLDHKKTKIEQLLSEHKKYRIP